LVFIDFDFDFDFIKFYKNIAFPDFLWYIIDIQPFPSEHSPQGPGSVAGSAEGGFFYARLFSNAAAAVTRAAPYAVIV
jgi:hypothetical protein